MNDYGYQGAPYGAEPDYYNLYTTEKVNEAKGVFSRFHLGLFAFNAITYAVVFLIEIALMLILGSDKTSELFANNIYIEWLMSVAPMYLVGFPAFVLIIKGMKTLPRQKSKMRAEEFFLLFAISQGVMLIGNMIGTTLNSFIGAILGREISNSTSELIEATPIWLVCLVVVIIGPIIEELMFRKLMIDRLGRYGDAVAITVSAISFGLFHGNFYQFFYAAMLGFVLGYIYTKTGNVTYSILMHMLINFFGSVLVMPIMEMMTELEEMSLAIAEKGEVDFLKYLQNAMAVGTYTLVTYVLALSGLVALIVCFTNKKIKLTGTCEYKLPRHKVADAVLLNVGVIVFIVMSLILFALSVFLV